MRVFIGSFSQSISGLEARGEGIYCVDFDVHSGKIGHPVLSVKADNPSYLARAGDTLYATRELPQQDNPGLTAWRIDASGLLQALWSRDIAGGLPCHVSVASDGQLLAVACYETGEVMVSPTVAEGPISIARIDGCGPHTHRQEGPHAHWTGFSDNNSVIHATDLGTDRILSLALDQNGSVLSRHETKLPAGCGPRHAVLRNNGQSAIVLCELDETLLSLTRDGLGWQLNSVVPAFGQSAINGEGAAAAIKRSADERHFYVSGRGQDVVAGFSLDAQDQLVGIGRWDAGGDTPRDIAISPDGHWLLVANQSDDNVTFFRRDTYSGHLSLHARVDVPTPCALVF